MGQIKLYIIVAVVAIVILVGIAIVRKMLKEHRAEIESWERDIQELNQIANGFVDIMMRRHRDVIILDPDDFVTADIERKELVEYDVRKDAQ